MPRWGNEKPGNYTHIIPMPRNCFITNAQFGNNFQFWDQNISIFFWLVVSTVSTISRVGSLARKHFDSFAHCPTMLKAWISLLRLMHATMYTTPRGFSLTSISFWQLGCCHLGVCGLTHVVTLILRVCFWHIIWLWVMLFTFSSPVLPYCLKFSLFATRNIIYT